MKKILLIFIVPILLFSTELTGIKEFDDILNNKTKLSEIEVYDYIDGFGNKAEFGKGKFYRKIISEDKNSYLIVNFYSENDNVKSIGYYEDKENVFRVVEKYSFDKKGEIISFGESNEIDGLLKEKYYYKNGELKQETIFDINSDFMEDNQHIKINYRNGNLFMIFDKEGIKINYPNNKIALIYKSSRDSYLDEFYNEDGNLVNEEEEIKVFREIEEIAVNEMFFDDETQSGMYIKIILMMMSLGFTIQESNNVEIEN